MRTKRVSVTAAMISIGNELLSGRIPDSNAPFVIKELRSRGVTMGCLVTLPDDVKVIAETLKRLQPRYDFILTSGGIGPTHDDVTLQAVAKAFHLPLVRDKGLAKAIKIFYGKHFHRSVLKMADLPQGSTLIKDSQFPVPVVLVKNVYVLPGDPTFFRNKFMNIQGRFRGSPFCLARLYLKLDEADVAELLQKTEKRFSGVAIGSYPRYDIPDYRVLITIESKVQNRVNMALTYLQKNLPRRSILTLNLYHKN